MSGLTTVGFFLFSIFFSIVTFVLWARIALRYFHVSALHPLSRNIAAITDAIIKPITQLFPAKKTRRSRYDVGAIIVLFAVEMIKFTLIGALFLTTMMPFWIFLAYVLGDLIVQPCNLLFYAIVIRVIMSWVNPTWHNPMADVLRAITEPLLKPMRKHLPTIAGFDISPYLALVGLKAVMLFITASLPLHLI